MKTVLDLLTSVAESFEKARIENPGYEAQYIAASILKIPRLELFIHRDRTVSEKEFNCGISAAEERITGKPLQYILGNVNFMGLDYDVNQSVLIPRLETELLVQRIIDDFREAESLKVLEIGSGSGIISISLANHKPDWSIHSCDISYPALEVSRKNAQTNQVEVEFFYSDIFSDVCDSYDVIVSNPPYIAEDEYQQLAVEITQYEPKNALIASENGLFFFRRILEDAAKHLKPGGSIYFEIGSKQAEAVKKLARKSGFKMIEVIQDYNKYDRIVIVRKTENGVEP